MDGKEASMIPESTIITEKDNILYWKNTDSNITYEDAQNISREIHRLVNEKQYKAMIVDNSEMRGVWSPEFDQIWIELMRSIPNQVEKTVTICENFINKLQVDYLSSQTEFADRIRTYTISEKEEMTTFLETPLK